ncbi:MAG: hypothetical protein ACYDDU_01120 [Dermatophilaceae bacterium]
MLTDSRAIDGSVSQPMRSMPSCPSTPFATPFAGLQMTAKTTGALAAENARGMAKAVRKSRVARTRVSRSRTTASAPSTPGTTVNSVNSRVLTSTWRKSGDASICV